MATIVEDFLADLARAGIRPHRARLPRRPARLRPDSSPDRSSGSPPQVLRAYLGNLADQGPRDPSPTRSRAGLPAGLGLPSGDDRRRPDDPPRPHPPTRLAAPRPAPTGHRSSAVLGRSPPPATATGCCFCCSTPPACAIGEALAIEVDDLDLSRDDEHVTVWARAAGGAPSCWTPQPRGPAAALPTGARLPTRALISRRERTTSAARYGMPPPSSSGPNTAEKAQVNGHDPSARHVHATELVNAEVSLETIRRRLGHANAQTVLSATHEQTDATPGRRDPPLAPQKPSPSTRR